MATKRMWASTKSIVKSSVSLFAGIGIATLAASHAALAQTNTVNTVNPLQDLNNQEQANPFSSRGGDQVKGVMEMIHNAVLGPSMSDSDFRQAQQENFNSAIDEFRAKQQRMLGNNQGQSAATPAPAPAPAPTTGN